MQAQLQEFLKGYQPYKVFISFKVKLDDFEESTNSPQKQVKGLQWQILADKFRVSDGNYLSFHLECRTEPESGNWKCHAQIILRLISHLDSSKTISEWLNFTYTEEESNWGSSFFAKWENVENPQNGFIQDNTITLEAHIRVDNRGNPAYLEERVFSIGIENQVLLLRPQNNAKKLAFSAFFAGGDVDLSETIITVSGHGSDVNLFLTNTGRPDDLARARFIDLEISLMSRNLESKIFRVSGFVNEDTGGFSTKLCVLTELTPFVHEKGVTINISLRMSDIPAAIRVQPMVSNYLSRTQSSLASSLWKNREFSGDYVIKCQGENVYCHKAVLANSCSAFDSMIQSGMKEQRENTLEIKDMSAEGLKAFLKLIYGAWHPKDGISPPLAFEILKAAEKYQMPDLKVLALDVLGESNDFPMGMVLELFAFCGQVGHIDLMRKVVKVFKLKGKDYLKSDEFAEILKTELGQELLLLSN